MVRRMKKFALITVLIALPLSATADPAQILAVDLRPSGTSWVIDVTLEHTDTGWDDYADGWRVEDADGTVLGTRILHHPHVNEQPFTRSLYDLELPEGLHQVHIRASTSVTGWSDARLVVDLPE